jgi:16S rRNA pseudouridine516 synthase
MRRLDQLIASLGYGSRREVRAQIEAGRVQVAGRVEVDPGAHVDAAAVTLGGQPLDHPGELLLVLNKPEGRVCSRDPAEGPSVYDLLPARWRQRNPPVVSVGRLDKDTTGVLLLTDRSSLVHRLTSPRSKVPKTYRVTLDRVLPDGAEETLAGGRCVLPGEDSPCAPATLRRLQALEVEIVLTEGRYHQVKRMFAALGCAVASLQRTHIGDLGVEGLLPGQWRELPLNRFGDF